jgi:diacylglycerol kinase family enzyme
VSLVAFVINRALLRDPRRFAQRCRAAAEDRGWEPWFAPDPVPGRAAANRAAAGRATPSGTLTGRAFAGRTFADSAAADSPALTRRAVAAGAGLVVAAGGDGTVRACAEALAGTGIPLAIVPLGTANLVARALGVPGQADRALAVAFGGQDRLIDLGRVTGVDVSGVEAEGGAGIVFTAMAGIGLDAAVVGAAWPRVKQRLGWVAYGMAAVPRLGWPASDFTIRVDEAAPLRRRARCVVVANAGLLPGGFTLLPAARLDDGLLDVGILAPTGGWDWLRLGGQILGGQILGGRIPGGRGLGGQILGGRGRSGRAGGLEGGRGRLVEISADRVLPRQADGEILVPARVLGASVTPGALVLRLAR